MMSSVLHAAALAPSPRATSRRCSTEDCSTIMTCIAANAPKPEGFL